MKTVWLNLYPYEKGLGHRWTMHDTESTAKANAANSDAVFTAIPVYLPQDAELKNLSSFNDINKNLEILAEECAEVIQIKSKIIRFGLNDYHPKNGMPNRDALEQELGDILAMIDILTNNGILTKEGLGKAKVLKLEKLPMWYNQINPDTHVCKCHYK